MSVHNWFQEEYDFRDWELEDEVLLLEWEGDDQRDHFWSIREICLICGNSLSNCTCIDQDSEKLPIRTILRPFTPERMNYPRHIQYRPLWYIPEAKFSTSTRN